MGKAKKKSTKNWDGVLVVAKHPLLEGLQASAARADGGDPRGVALQAVGSCTSTAALMGTPVPRTTGDPYALTTRAPCS